MAENESTQRDAFGKLSEAHELMREALLRHQARILRLERLVEDLVYAMGIEDFDLRCDKAATLLQDCMDGK